MAATTLERIQDLVEGLEADVRKATIVDVLIDLKECLKAAPANETAGLRAAIEIIESNYA